MLNKYEPHFTSLPVPCVQLVYESLRIPPVTDGSQLYRECSIAGFSHADVVTSIAKYSGEIATIAIEALVGKPIVRKQTAYVEPMSRSRTKKRDPRVVTFKVDGNPKLSGTKAFALWELYTVGMTADEFIAAGGTRSALRYDSDRGYIKLEMPCR